MEYQLLQRVLQYISKPDKTNCPIEALVSGSQNVLINDGEKVQTRSGYSIYGAVGSGSSPIESSYDWQTSSNTTLNLRAYDDELEVYIGTVESKVFNSWEKVADSWTAVDFSFDSWWSSTEGINLLLFVNGSDKIQEWSGAMTTYASCTANTITKQGTGTWAQSRFLVNGTTKIRIKDTGGTWREFTYTGGETTTTLTGVAPDPTVGLTFAAGALVMQSVRENDDKPIDGWVNDFIKVHNNQLWIGSNVKNAIYVSKDTDFTSFAYSSPRVPGEGALLNLRGVGRGFAIQRDKILVAAGKSEWYVNDFEQLDIGGILSETLKIKKLKTGEGSACQHHDLITEVGDYVVFIDFNNQVMILGDIENLEQPSLQSLSDPIKPDFDAEDFTNGHIKAHKNRIYICSPVNSTVWINETRLTDKGLLRFWQPPQIMPIRRFAIIGDLIYGHSSGFDETYKLFDGTSDNEKPINFQAHYPYRNYGDRFALKKFDQWATEGYIRGNTKITLQLRYDFLGSEQTLEKEIDGSDENLLFDVLGGPAPLGQTPLGIMEQSTQQPKFRHIAEFAPRDFYEIQAVYYSSAKDDQWELISQGGNILLSPNKSNFYTR